MWFNEFYAPPHAIDGGDINCAMWKRKGRRARREQYQQPGYIYIFRFTNPQEGEEDVRGFGTARTKEEIKRLLAERAEQDGRQYTFESSWKVLDVHQAYATLTAPLRAVGCCLSEQESQEDS